MSTLNHQTLQQVARLLDDADAILIGAGAGLSAAAGINYLDREKFAQVYPGWVKKGFRTQYDLMGYSAWTQREQWGYYKVHLEYVYFSQKENPLYRALYERVKDKTHFVMTSNVDGLFYKSGFDRHQVYTPQGDYGKIQCTVPCSQEVWDIKPFLDKMDESFDSMAQVLTSDEAVPKCPNCGEDMFIHARIDGSFIDTVHEEERQRLIEWLNANMDKKVVVLDLGSGFNTPTVIRKPMEQITASFPDTTLVRVNLDHANVPPSLGDKAIAVQGDIRAFVEGISQPVSTA
ncbi:Sir2 family NAD-dependent protein deacetylase [Enterovibrio baiacu]|uniref:Sir2 family NAD-dependent protein deacetylase n=1 Tax=Enterovibrio baiacu TaxID=2491023 RepID=UPI001012625B|nr:Sir2 family NAD-dependent protein deacetylase [Enterovibrio baiacu]MBE1276692.1 NAD-dependent protein deacetylase of SIR2 family [Enterovibrio baiacu]